MGMMYFQIEEDKVENISQYLKNGLRCIGKAMQCVDEMMEHGAQPASGERMGYRDEPGEYGGTMGRERMGMRGDGYTGQMGNRGGMRMGRRDMSDPYYM